MSGFAIKHSRRFRTPRGNASAQVFPILSEKETISLTSHRRRRDISSSAWVFEGVLCNFMRMYRYICLFGCFARYRLEVNPSLSCYLNAFCQLVKKALCQGQAPNKLSEHHQTSEFCYGYRFSLSIVYCWKSIVFVRFLYFKQTLVTNVRYLVLTIISQ